MSDEKQELEKTENEGKTLEITSSERYVSKDTQETIKTVASTLSILSILGTFLAKMAELPLWITISLASMFLASFFIFGLSWYISRSRTMLIDNQLSILPDDWQLQEQSPKLLKAKEDTKELPLDIEIKDVFLVSYGSVWDANLPNSTVPQFVTIELSITNHDIKNTTIRDCELFVEKEVGRVKGKWRETPFIKSMVMNRTRGKLVEKIDGADSETIIFSQGIEKKYNATFLFNDESESLNDNTGSIFRKKFFLQITDSYRNVYNGEKLEGATPNKFIFPNL